MNIVRALLLTAAILSLSGCSYKGPKTAADRAGSDKGTTLVNTYWKLVTIDGAPIDTPAGKREVHLILRLDYRVTGFGGCNGFSGSWTWENEQLVVGPLMSTMMACPEMETESALLSALDGEVFTEISGETLSLTGSDGGELTFVAVYFP